jgi:GntR family transcriptional regulator
MPAQIPTPPNSATGRRQLGAGQRTSLPVYHQLHLVLSQRIRDRVHAPGTQFPSETDLAAQFGVSRVTVRNALAMLQREGLITRRRGAGTYVTASKDGNPPAISGLVENLITIGLETQARLLGYGPDDQPPPYVREALARPAPAAIVRIDRLRLHRAVPFSLTALYLPPENAALIGPTGFDNRAAVALLEAAGLTAGSAEQTLSATLADDQSGPLLDVRIGAPLVRLRRTVFDTEGTPMLFQQSLYRPDHYEYHMLLTREQSADRPRWRPVG